MNLTKRQNTSILLACGLALIALPCAFADHMGEHSDAMFKAMDTNGDGKVSRAEHAAGAVKMFTDADTNHDGMLTLAEMKAAHAKMKTDKPARAGSASMNDKSTTGDKAMKDDMSAEEMFKMCDTNGDGQVSQAEHAAHADAMFTKMDTDGDGFLSASEFSAGHMGMMKDKKSGY